MYFLILVTCKDHIFWRDLHVSKLFNFLNFFLCFFRTWIQDFMNLVSCCARRTKYLKMQQRFLDIWCWYHVNHFTKGCLTTKIVIQLAHLVLKGQLISKWLSAILEFFQKNERNNSTIVGKKKTEFVILSFFLQEWSAWKKHYDFVWSLRRP